MIVALSPRKEEFVMDHLGWKLLNLVPRGIFPFPSLFFFREKPWGARNCALKFMHIIYFLYDQTMSTIREQ